MKLSLIQPKLGSKLITLMALTFVLLMIGASGLAIEVPDLDRIQSGLIDGHSVTLAGALPVPTASFDFALNVPASSELVHVDSGSANADSLQPLSVEAITSSLHRLAHHHLSLQIRPPQTYQLHTLASIPAFR